MSARDKATKKFRKELHSGTVGLLLLGLLAERGEPMYGYQVIKELEATVGDRLAIAQGTIYPVLRSLEAQKLLDSWIEPPVAGPPRKYYGLTRSGRHALAAWTEIWRATRDGVDALIDPNRHGRRRRVSRDAS